ncbi:MAG: hypothetical protein ACREQ7_24030 [Candidatus Binatia bacterium]
MKNFIFRALVLVLLMQFFALKDFAHAQTKNFKIAYSALSGSSFPIWIAKDARLFEKYGLTADLIYIPSSSLALQTMLGGNVQIIPTASAPTIMQAKIQGADIKPSAVKLAIDLLAGKDPKFRTARPEDFIDNSVVKEIEDSGFVEKLYGRKN